MSYLPPLRNPGPRAKSARRASPFGTPNAMADSDGSGAAPTDGCAEAPSPPAFDANIHALILLQLLINRSDGIPMWESEAGRDALTYCTAVAPMWHAQTEEAAWGLVLRGDGAPARAARNTSAARQRSS